MGLPQDHPSYKYTQIANHALERATALTKQLLTFAKGGDPIIELVNIVQIAQDSIEFNLSGSNVKTVQNMPDNLWQVKADKSQLSQVIANLTINAKQAMPEGGVIYIDAENIKDIVQHTAYHLSGDYIKLSVRDEGVGIAPKHIDKIFEPYFTTKQTGSGLGLATVQNIIAKHHGHISIESQLGVGATFIIYLPAEKYSDKATYTIPLSVTEHEKNTPAHILIMDDYKFVRELSVATLESFGHKVDSAVDGKETIEKYISVADTADSFDVIIMDLTIPGGMGGKETINKLLTIEPAHKLKSPV